ncbi:MAG TPA: VOC family protein [Solirubrobacterales bacterium]|nr:VOC family protein [Solirubrobacterales bacterium]
MSAARPASGLFADPRPIEALGDLFANVWQVCYVTPDLDRGMQELRDLFGIENMTEVPVEGASFLKAGERQQWDVRVAMGARGGLIVELIEPIAGEVEFYRRALGDGAVLGLHHLAMLVPLGDEAWEALQRLLAEHGMAFEYTILIPDRARLAYVDTSEQLGHWIELCQLQKADTDFFSGLIAEST